MSARSTEAVLIAGKPVYREACLVAAARSDLDANTTRLVRVLAEAVRAAGAGS